MSINSYRLSRLTTAFSASLGSTCLSCPELSTCCWGWPRTIVRRLAIAAGARGKPSIVVTKNLDLYLGNESNAVLKLEPGELAGFNIGSYIEKIVEGSQDVSCCSGTKSYAPDICTGAGEKEQTGLAWRLQDDFTLISRDKKLEPLCCMLHGLVTQRGLAEVDIQEHVIKPKMHPAAAFKHTKYKIVLSLGHSQGICCRVCRLGE